MSLMRPRKIGNHHGEHLGRTKWVLFCDQDEALLPCYCTQPGGKDLEYYQSAPGSSSHGVFTNGCILNKFRHRKAEWNQPHALEMMFSFRHWACSSPPCHRSCSSQVNIGNRLHILDSILCQVFGVQLDVHSFGRQRRWEPSLKQFSLPVFCILILPKQQDDI